MADDRDEFGRRLQHALMRARLAVLLSGRTPVVWSLLALLVICTAVAEGLELFVEDMGRDDVLVAAGLMPERVRGGEWWRLFSGPLLHRGWSHLALNGIGLVLIGRPVEGAFGSLRVWWIWCGATLMGALGTMSAGHMLSVGASASVFGLIGALVAIGLRLWPRLSPGLRTAMVLLPVAIVGLMFAMGLVADEIAGVDQVDHHAHLAGGLGGALLGLVLRLRLRDQDGAEWAFERGELAVWRSRALHAGAAGLLLLFCLGLATAASRVGTPLTIESPQSRVLSWRDLEIPLPAPWRSGIWRGNHCQGAMVDGRQVLEARRILCIQLPLGGVLLVGRRDQLLTMDRQDTASMRQGNRQGRLVRRQPGVLLYPLGAAHLYVVIGADALLPTWKEALRSHLPPPGSATVQPHGQPMPDHEAPLDSAGLPTQASRAASAAGGS